MGKLNGRVTSTETVEVVDERGRTLSVQRLTALDRLRLFEAAGAELSRNDRWLGMAIIASSVVAIDSIPYPFPNSKSAIEAMVQRLGVAGHAAAAAAFSQDAPADRAVAGN